MRGEGIGGRGRIEDRECEKEEERGGDDEEMNKT